MVVQWDVLLGKGASSRAHSDYPPYRHLIRTDQAETRTRIDDSHMNTIRNSLFAPVNPIWSLVCNAHFKHSGLSSCNHNLAMTNCPLNTSTCSLQSRQCRQVRYWFTNPSHTSQMDTPHKSIPFDFTGVPESQIQSHTFMDQLSSSLVSFHAQASDGTTRDSLSVLS